MKRLILLLIVCALALWVGCDKNPMPPTSTEQTQQSIVPDELQLPPELQARMDALKIQMQERSMSIRKLQEEKATVLRRSSGTSSKIKVPDDFPTIQEAVNAASPGDKIVVKRGAYNEVVQVYTPNLRISSAVKYAAIVNGAFAVFNTSGVTIEGFDVRGGADVACLIAYMATGIQFDDNKVSGADFGIWLHTSTDCIIEDNEVQSNNAGINLTDADASFIKRNRVFSNAWRGIWARFADDNTYKANKIHDNASTGFVMEDCFRNKVGDDNVVNKNGNNGIALSQSSYNKIGPENSASSNVTYGLWLLSGSDFNEVRKLIALNNGLCDIRNDGTGNTFKKNVVGCTIP
jgi:parallel beta-helix repeat protein